MFRARAKVKARAIGRRRAVARAMDGNRRVVAKEKGTVALEAIGEKEEKGISSRELQGRRRHSSTAIAIIVMLTVIGNETTPYSTRRWLLGEPRQREAIPERRVRALDGPWRCRPMRGILGMQFRVYLRVVRPVCSRFFLFSEAFGHDGDTDSEDEFPPLSIAPVVKKKRGTVPPSSR